MRKLMTVALMMASIAASTTALAGKPNDVAHKAKSHKITAHSSHATHKVKSGGNRKASGPDSHYQKKH